jgi:hypothetical protein
MDNSTHIHSHHQSHPILNSCPQYYKDASTEKKIYIIRLGSKVHQYLDRNPIVNENDVDTNVILLELEKRNEELQQELNEQKNRIHNIKQEEKEIAEQRIQNINEKYEEDLQYYETHITKLRRQLEKERDEIRNQTRNELSQLLKTKEEHIDTLKSQLNIIRGEFDNTRNDHLREIQSMRIQLEKTLEELEKEKEEHSREKIENVRSVTRGMKGEEFVLQEFETQWSNDWNFQKISNQARSMDIIISNPLLNITGGIEVKAYTNTVPKREIDKFRRDFEEKKDYTFGIFISLETGIANKDEFHVEYSESDGHPLIYVSKLHEMPRLISVIECYIKQWYHMSMKYDTNELVNYREILSEQILTSINSYKDIMKNTRQIMKIAENQLSSIEKIRMNIPSITVTQNQNKSISNKSIPNTHTPSMNRNMNINVAAPSIIPLDEISKEKKKQPRIQFNMLGKKKSNNITLQQYLGNIIEYSGGNSLSMDLLINKIPEKYYIEEKKDDIQKKRRFIINQVKNYLQKNNINSEYKKHGKYFSNITLKD